MIAVANYKKMKQINSWSVNKVLILLLGGAFAALLLDIRSEHVDVVRHNWKGWIPIVYSGIMLVVVAACLSLWDRGGRKSLFLAFAASLVVGILGFWFHSHGHPLDSLANVLEAWTMPLHHKDQPPAMAPLSYAGLGVFGMLLSSERFQPPEE